MAKMTRLEMLSAIDRGEKLPVSKKHDDWRDNARLLDDVFADGCVRADGRPLKDGEGAYAGVVGLRLTQQGRRELEAESMASTTGTASSIDPRSVFVVHGRNETLRKAMFDLLRSINLAPLEWSSAVALTGHGSPYIGQILDAAFSNAWAIVVLMTPDEVAYLRPEYASGPDDPETFPAAQARPNVLFEAGMALGRDERRTVLVEVGDVRPFSDVAGRHAVRLNNDVKTRQELARRLETAGCAVDLSGTDWHTTGDFTSPPPPGAGLPLGRRVPTAPAGARPRISFDLKYLRRGGRSIDKLQVINRGTETAFDVRLDAPEGSALSRLPKEPIAKIPGGGKSVTIDVMNENSFFGAQKDAAFDVHVTARTVDGEAYAQDVFLDMNG